MGKETRRRQAFVAMPMNKGNKRLVDVLNTIKRAAKRCGIKAERIDDQKRSERITDRIVEAIAAAEFVIVDLTYARPNVFWEAGFAHGLQKIPIYIARKRTKMHFNLKDYPVIEFENLTELENELLVRLKAISKAPRKTSVPKNTPPPPAQEADRRPQLMLVYAPDKTLPLSDGSRQTFLYAVNPSDTDVSGAQVKIEQAMYSRAPESLWEKTTIVARPNMSWADKADGDPNKYSAVQLAPGKEVIDFIWGPRELTQIITDESTGVKRHDTQRWFEIRIDPRQRHTVQPVFYQAGTYKFVMQVSARDAKPASLTLYVHWDESDFVIYNDLDQVLESRLSAKAGTE
jgi:hypothetical protein